MTRIPLAYLALPGCLVFWAFGLVLTLLHYVAFQFVSLGEGSSLFFAFVIWRGKLPHDASYALCCPAAAGKHLPGAWKRGQAARWLRGRVEVCPAHGRPS